MSLHLNPQLGDLVAVAGKDCMPPCFQGEVDTALLLSSAQADLLAQQDPATILKALGLNTLPRIVINLVGDVTLRYLGVGPMTNNSFQEMVHAKERLVDFMEEVVAFVIFTIFCVRHVFYLFSFVLMLPHPH